MNKKKTTTIFLVALVFAASFFYYTYINKTEDAQLVANVIEIEKNLVLAQAQSISIKELKDKTSPFIHSRYMDAYFDMIDRASNGTGGLLSLATDVPVYQYISKVYTSEDNTSKSIYIKIPVEDPLSQAAKLYIFKNDNNEWKIFSVGNYILVTSRNEPKKIIEKFTSYNDVPIEYEYTKILESIPNKIK